MKDYNPKALLRLFIPVIFLLIFTVFLNKAVISNPEAIRAWLSGFGGFAIAAYIVVQTLAIVIAPIGGSAFAFAILAIFGPFLGTLIIFAVTTPAYCINFFIARKYGRPVVHKLVGTDGERIVMRFMNEVDPRKLVLMKLFLGGYFDYISYAVGLSSITPREFIIINVLAGIPGAMINWTVMHFARSFLLGVMILYFIPILGGVMYLIIHNKTKKKTVAIVEHEI
jgi:uncharacterized membrane protein YdjX (TVP38/TMEM64 family)